MIIDRSFCILFCGLLGCAVLSSCILSSPAFANDKVDALLVKAVKYDKAGKSDKANKAYGLSLKLSQKIGDLMAEQKVTEALLEVIGRGDSRKPMAAFMNAPLVTVTRQATGFVIQEGFDKNYRKLHSFSQGSSFMSTAE